MVKFRVVILDDSDKIKEVVYESKEYKDKWDSNWSNDEYGMLIELNKKYNLTDWENAPYLETQILKNGEWYFHSNTIEDWFNL